MNPNITVEVFVEAPVEKAWQYFTLPEHITKWNFASDTWCCPQAENVLQVGGSFRYRMEAKDGSAGFDFEGTYTLIETHKKIEYALVGGRKVSINFLEKGSGCHITETFEAENENSLELQRFGWQSILDAFKKHVEAGA